MRHDTTKGLLLLCKGISLVNRALVSPGTSCCVINSVFGWDGHCLHRCTKYTARTSVNTCMQRNSSGLKDSKKLLACPQPPTTQSISQTCFLRGLLNRPRWLRHRKRWSQMHPTYRLDIPCLRDVTVSECSDWQQSNVCDEILKVEFQKACDVALEDDLDLGQVYNDQDPDFSSNIV
jgi:hypothetical protein